MPRSSRSKSHKQSKFSSKDVKEYSDSEEEVKVRDRNGKEEGSVRVSKDSASGDKRKLSKHPSGYGNGDVADEPVVSKRRKDKAESDRWNAGGEERNDDKDSKGENFKPKESKLSVDSRSKSSRRHDSAGERKDDTSTLLVDKEETRTASRVDSTRKSEKEHGRKEHRDVKEKDRWDKEKAVKDAKDGELAKKHESHSVGVTEERHGKRSRENTEWPVQEELRNPELEKELEKRIRRRGDGSSDKDKFQDDARDYDVKRSSRAERTKDVRYKDERHGDRYNEHSDKNSRHRDDKQRDDGDQGGRHKDAKYREDGEKDDRYRDAKHLEDIDRDITNYEDKYREGGDRDKRHKDDKYREDSERTSRRREDKYHEDGDKDDRRRDDKYREDINKDDKHKEEKHRENVDRDSNHRDAKQRNDSDRDKRSRDVKYRDEHSSRERVSESERKRMRDENNAADPHYRKSSTRDISPSYGDKGSRYNDDKGNRMATDKVDPNEVRSTKEQRFDTEKRSLSGKVDLVTDRGRSNFRNADVNTTLNHSHRRNSPGSSTHAARDHYRVSKLEESKYRDYAYEERVRHNVSSSREFTGAKQNEKLFSSRSMEKSIQKDDSHFDESIAERRPRSDARVSPLRMMDKSPSSATTDRRHLHRSDVRRAIDTEESGQRSGGYRDYSRKGSRELPMETHAIDEYTKADGDHSSGSSPFTRNNFSGNSRSTLPPPPPFRTGIDSPSVLGSSEDDNRGRFNNRHRRPGDPNMGRSQGNAWKGLQNWPSPVANGYVPFQHGPPPVAFHPVMQQFPAPPIFGVRPTMDLNHNLPYPMSDADRFSGHVRPLGWRNSVDDSCAPPLHVWDGNNSVFSDDTRVYGRSDWDQNRTQMVSRGWDTSGDVWKGHTSGLSSDLTSAQKADLHHPASDEVLAGQEALVKQKQPNAQADSVDVQFSDALRDVTSDVLENTASGSRENSKISVKDDVHHYNVYLSKLDISTDLAEPDLYDQFTKLIDLDPNAVADEDDFKIIYVEEALEAKLTDRLSSDTFLATSDSVFQKAMSLYEKQKGRIGATNRERVPPLDEPKVVQASENEKDALNDDNSGAVAPNCDGQEVKEAVPYYKEHVDLAWGSEALEVTGVEKLDEPSVIDNLIVPAEQVKTVNMIETKLDQVSILKVVDMVMEDKSSSILDVEPSNGILPEAMQCRSPVVGDSAANNEQKLVETKSGVAVVKSDVSGEAESIECGFMGDGPRGIQIFPHHFQASTSAPHTQPSHHTPDFQSGSPVWARRKLRTAASMFNLFSIRTLPWLSAQQKVVLTAPELESLRTQLSDLEEREAHRKAQLEHLDEILRSARLSGYLYMRTRWEALPGEPAPLDDDAEIDDWLPRFVVLHGSCIFLYLISTDLSPQDSTLLSDVVGVGRLPCCTREDGESRHNFYILTRQGLRYECSSVSKIQIDAWLMALQDYCT